MTKLLNSRSLSRGAVGRLRLTGLLIVSSLLFALIILNCHLLTVADRTKVSAPIIRILAGEVDRDAAVVELIRLSSIAAMTALAYMITAFAGLYFSRGSPYRTPAAVLLMTYYAALTLQTVLGYALLPNPGEELRRGAIYAVAGALIYLALLWLVAKFIKSKPS